MAYQSRHHVNGMKRGDRQAETSATRIPREENVPGRLALISKALKDNQYWWNRRVRSKFS